MGTLYILAGKSGTRKSATIRALVGFTKGNPWQVTTVDSGIISVIVIPSSPQEAPEAFEQALLIIQRQGKAHEILLALHPDKRASKAIEQIPANNRRSIRWVLLGEEEPSKPFDLRALLGTPDHVLADSRETPANAIAQSIRERWGWL